MVEAVIQKKRIEDLHAKKRKGIFGTTSGKRIEGILGDTLHATERAKLE